MKAGRNRVYLKAAADDKRKFFCTQSTNFMMRFEDLWYNLKVVFLMFEWHCAGKIRNQRSTKASQGSRHAPFFWRRTPSGSYFKLAIL